MSVDDDYVQALRDGFDRYLVAVVRPLLSQNRDLKAALQAERRRAVASETGGGIRKELDMLQKGRDGASQAQLYGIPLLDYTRDELLGAVVDLGEKYTQGLVWAPKR